MRVTDDEAAETKLIHQQQRNKEMGISSYLLYYLNIQRKLLTQGTLHSILKLS